MRSKRDYHTINVFCLLFNSALNNQSAMLHLVMFLLDYDTLLIAKNMSRVLHVVLTIMHFVSSAHTKMGTCLPYMVLDSTGQQ